MTEQSGRINLISFTGRVELIQFGSSLEVRGCGQLSDQASIIQAYFAGRELVYEGSCKCPDGSIRQVRVPITLWNPNPRPERTRDVYFESLVSLPDPCQT